LSEHRTVSAAVSLSETSARGDEALDDVETAEGEGRRCPDTERFPLPSLSETLARGGGALDDVETAEGEGRRCPNTKMFPLPSLSETSARGDGALDGVETAEGEDLGVFALSCPAVKVIVSFPAKDGARRRAARR